MIVIEIQPSGDLTFRCSLCERMETVPLEDIKNIFGDIYIGQTVAIMAGHFCESHPKVPAP